MRRDSTGRGRFRRYLDDDRLRVWRRPEDDGMTRLARLGNWWQRLLCRHELVRWVRLPGRRYALACRICGGISPGTE